MDISAQEWEICLKVLQQISEDSTLVDNQARFKSLIAKIYKNGKKNVRHTQKQEQKSADSQLKAATAIVQSQLQKQPIAALSASTQSSLGQLIKPLHCYICKQPYTEIHFFYHQLCPKCADFNYQKRLQRTDLKGRVALITGGRIKIGYQTALRMLRDGAKVILTTRFPLDAAQRFSKESDFTQWQERLQIYALDLRHIGAVEAFANYLLKTETSLDIIINNAAQTIKRPLAFYQHLLEEEKNLYSSASAQALVVNNNSNLFLLESNDNYSEHLLTGENYFPANTFDADGQQLDARPVNSWRLKLNEVSSQEMLEVHLINAVAPFILNRSLKSLLVKSSFTRRFIINVSAMEGQFNRVNKTIFHPHTNMAKAALNMMTRTSAADYASDRIFMNSVDTGWITDENPYPMKTHLQENRGFYAPLDAIDGMARIYDPIVQGIENPAEPLYGHFLKDYQPHSW